MEHIFVPFLLSVFSVRILFLSDWNTLLRLILVPVSCSSVFETGALTSSSALAKINSLGSVLRVCITRNHSVPYLNPQMIADRLPMPDKVFIKQPWRELVIAFGVQHK